eukprot:CAMPEP_0173465358 /NCGR_PEP_ID=MMETSP1357-20121228/71485_1 /TAXON_ID=77926 /ORGANISM="Hemiselmis rufescens, Strain PCC563" /LENGTH=563 /DNA_ID=CAMNT_0014433335 /DNA_START=38 /DNA_END=1726 /DNA_ORIENTATION=-
MPRVKWEEGHPIEEVPLKEVTLKSGKDSGEEDDGAGGAAQQVVFRTPGEGDAEKVTTGDIVKMAKDKLWDQFKGVMPVCVFLAGFQVAVLGQTLPGAPSIAVALVLAIVGLALFNFGLLCGLMPLGEKLGQGLPHAVSQTTLLIIALLLGVAVTLAEPALGVVKTAGSLITEVKAPYLYTLLHQRQDFLVLAVAGGVGASASLGMLRTRHAWSLKRLVYVLVPFTLVLSLFVTNYTSRGDVLGLAWDLGAVTTGPVTVPLVIALGVGVAGAGHNASPLTGFGVVTLASLIPVDFVLVLALLLPHKHGRRPMISSEEGQSIDPVAWYDETPYMEIVAGIRALVPLVMLMYALKKFALKDPYEVLVPVELPHSKTVHLPVRRGLWAAQIGIIVFNIGLTNGLSKLGAIVGGTTPSAFTAVDSVKGSPIYGSGVAGSAVACIFVYMLGFGATLAEPALATLATTVEKLTDKGLTQRQVVLSVAVGVGTGTALGLLKIIWGIPLMYLLVPGYAIALALTVPSQEVYVCVAWDSAGVTTGPVTVPLVISLGLGIGKAVGVADGFGILS